jgi:hypothetical protein
MKRPKELHFSKYSCLRFFVSVLFVLTFCLASAPVHGALNFGTPYSEIGTFNGWTFWVGWDGSFSETYLPESETYAWVVYFAPEGIFVALQAAKSVYSAVDVFAGVDYFYGALVSPNGNKLTRDYINSLLGVNISINSWNFAPPVGSPFFTLSAAIKSGQTLFRQGSVNSLERGVQYTAGISVSNSLIPMPIPISVSLDYESWVEAGFYPILEWNLSQPSQNPVDQIISGLEAVAASSGTTFNDIMGRQMAESLLPFMRTLPSSPYFKEFLASQTHNTAVDQLIQEAEQWLGTGDTTKLPEKIQPPVEPQEMHRLMLPIYSATQTAFEMGYKHGCDHNSNCTTLYADCLKTVNCTPGQLCTIEVKASEIAALVPGSVAADFEGAWVGFDRPFDQYLTQQGEVAWMTIESGKAVFQFTLSTNTPMLLGVRVDASDATGNKAIELCRRKIVYPPPVNTPIAFAGPDQTVAPGAAVTLRGFEFVSPENPATKYAWSQTAGPAVTLSSTNEAQTTFLVPKSGSAGLSYTFLLTVTDSGGLTDTDSVTVDVKKPKPVGWLPLLLSD